jgi:hypothetical protein
MFNGKGRGGMPKFKLYPGLDLYDSGVVDGFVALGYSLEQALQTVQAFLPVMKKLGRYDNVETMAERIHEAIQRGSTPESWLAYIKELEKYPEPRAVYLTKLPRRKGVIKVTRNLSTNSR